MSVPGSASDRIENHSLSANTSAPTLTNESLATATKVLAHRDRHLGLIYKTLGVPPMWGRRPGFETLLRIVLE